MRTIDTGTDDLLGEVDEGVATLTLNRPERRNAMSQAMNEALARALAEVEVADGGRSPSRMSAPRRRPSAGRAK